MRLTDGAQPVKAVVPMSFRSALAGIMLAADLVKHASGFEYADHEHTDQPASSTRRASSRSQGERHVRTLHLRGPGFPSVLSLTFESQLVANMIHSRHGKRLDCT